jgi:hypothetical protein
MYTIGTEVRIIEDYVWHDVNSYILGRSGTVISCARKTNDSLYYIVVYTLFDECKAYGPMVMAKGPPNSFCIGGDEVQQIRDHSGWYVWPYPHPEHWGLPSKHDVDREIRGLKFPNVILEHWREGYWGKRWIECELLLSRMGTNRYGGQTQICETHSPIRRISIVRNEE